MNAVPLQDILTADIRPPLLAILIRPGLQLPDRTHRSLDTYLVLMQQKPFLSVITQDDLARIGSRMHHQVIFHKSTLGIIVQIDPVIQILIGDPLKHPAIGDRILRDLGKIVVVMRERLLRHDLHIGIGIFKTDLVDMRMQQERIVRRSRSRPAGRLTPLECSRLDHGMRLTLELKTAMHQLMDPLQIVRIVLQDRKTVLLNEDVSGA